MRSERAQAVRRTTSLTALVDVVFLLLLFFMLASTFSRFSVIEVGLGGTGRPAATAVQTLDRVLLTVDAEGRIGVNGQLVDRAVLAETLRRSGTADTQRILLRPTARATTQDIVSALELARSAGAGDVILVR